MNPIDDVAALSFPKSGFWYFNIPKCMRQPSS